MSYAQLSGFEALAADAAMTPHLRAKVAFARMGVEMFHRCERVGVRLRELGADHEVAMTPFVASVDAFQSWIYTSGEGRDGLARDRAWLRIRGRFERGVDWSGLERERVARWYRQLHIFLYPFYYIEYGIAQLGALQLYANYQRDRAGAIAAYKRALGLGGSRPLPELFKAADLSFDFSPARIQQTWKQVEKDLAGLGV